MISAIKAVQNNRKFVFSYFTVMEEMATEKEIVDVRICSISKINLYLLEIINFTQDFFYVGIKNILELKWRSNKRRRFSTC